jgi:SRSO17 transposase
LDLNPATRQINKESKKGAYHASSPLRGVDRHFRDFHRRFSHHFHTRTRNISQRAEQYFKGLIQSRKRNMERMAEVVPDSDDQSLQHFLTHSGWDENDVVDQTAYEADQLIGGQADSCLLIDETGFKKSGTKSVGVSRQWCGRLGKVDNCQVGVFAVLANRAHCIPIDYRLFLPQEWVQNKARCLAAGVPEEAIEFNRKHDLALQMVIASRARGVRFNWIGCDGFYGEDPSFLLALDRMHEIFMVDVHKDQHIYLQNPDPIVPPAKSKKGRKPSRLKAQTEPIRVDQWVRQQPDEAWRRVTIRDTTKGKLRVNMLHQRVWLWDGKQNHAEHWHLIVRREVKSSKIKYSLSNASAGTSLKRLAYMQAQRYWVERSFQDAKTSCGMSDYQARGWRSWHHHMALVMMAMLFMLEQRISYKGSHPLLSCQDIISLLCNFLPKRSITSEEVLRQLEVRHKKRTASIESAYRKQRKRHFVDQKTNVTK